MRVDEAPRRGAFEQRARQAARERVDQMPRRARERCRCDEREMRDARGMRAGVVRRDESAQRVSDEREALETQHAHHVVEHAPEIREIERRGGLVALAEAGQVERDVAQRRVELRHEPSPRAVGPVAQAVQ